MGGTLIASREIKNHAHFKNRFEALGFPNVSITSADKDGLNFIIQDKKPELIIMGARFYQCCTPYMMGELIKRFPKINMAAVCIGEYPADLAMYFIMNGVKGYVNTFDGIDDFYTGLDVIRAGKEYIPNSVQERIDMRKHNYPMPAHTLPPKLVEVTRCICNGFNKYEIGDTLQLSVRTVANYREEIYRSLNVRNGEELYCAALTLGIVTQEELVFRHRNFTLKPLPKTEIKSQRSIKR
jgi:DNA-binding NarL/FixJ family response regulator